MKTIVTHISPDVDAVTSVWLLKRFLPGWGNAQLAFAPAGNTLNNEIVDIDPNILHVDTGLGRLDHHQSDEDTCAAKRTWEYIRKQETRNKKQETDNDAMERFLDVVNNIDHFREVYYPNPTADFYDLGLVGILDGLKLLRSYDDQKIVDFSLSALDGIYKTFQNKVWAEAELKEKGLEFKTKWGKGLAIETINDEAVRLAQKQGFTLAVRKDPNKGFVRIKAQPESQVDFTSCYNIYKEKDKEATWYLHSGKKMILNGSVKNPQSKPTSLTLKEIIEVLKLK